MDNDITVLVNGRRIAVPAGSTAAAAIAMAGSSHFRTSIKREPRGPVCGMGICFECRVTIDGQPHRRSCRTACRPGMEIQTDEP